MPAVSTSCRLSSACCAVNPPVAMAAAGKARRMFSLHSLSLLPVALLNQPLQLLGPEKEPLEILINPTFLLVHQLHFFPCFSLSDLPHIGIGDQTISFHLHPFIKSTF